MDFISDYMEDSGQRHMLNELTRKTFWFDFEAWVTGGWFKGDYIPYSYAENGRLVSNASVNIMKFRQNGVLRNYIQIGTVMTAEEYRNRGLAASLIKRILSDYSDSDGVYLFGNLDALGFYRKLGFSECFEYRYSVKPEYFRKGASAAVFKPAAPEMLGKYLDAVQNFAENSSFEHLNKYGLQLFYTAELSDVFYSKELDCFAIIENDGENLVLKSVVSKKRIPLEKVIAAIDMDYSVLRLGFTPLPEERGLCSCELYDGGDDYRFFFMGDALKSIENERLYFPELSHA